MIRSLLVEVLPVVATTAAMLYTQPRKGWVWAIPAGVGAHLVAGWAMRRVATALEGAVLLPPQSVTVKDGQIEVPPVADPAKFHGIAPQAPAEQVSGVVPTSQAIEVWDRNDNVIKLPTAIGEP